ncbi:MAG: hypothetical protein K2P67_07705 [Gallionellaceae bacterium]|nr:hypothetical protein [Gallionellaceae bacterium]
MNATENLITHLLELRARLLHVSAALLLAFICLFPWAADLYTLMAQPLLANNDRSNKIRSKRPPA